MRILTVRFPEEADRAACLNQLRERVDALVSGAQVIWASGPEIILVGPDDEIERVFVSLPADWQPQYLVEA